MIRNRQRIRELGGEQVAVGCGNRKPVRAEGGRCAAQRSPGAQRQTRGWISRRKRKGVRPHSAGGADGLAIGLSNNAVGQTGGAQGERRGLAVGVTTPAGQRTVGSAGRRCGSRRQAHLGKGAGRRRGLAELLLSPQQATVPSVRTPQA